MRVTSKGQVTIPKNIREQLGILPNSEVEFVAENGRVYLIKGELEDSPFRRLRGAGSVQMTTDEIMALTRSWS
jgi:antitoxin PrlF